MWCIVTPPYRGGPKEGVPGTMALAPLEPVVPPAAALVVPLPPWAAITAPPTAAPPTTAAMAIHLLRADFTAGSAFVCVIVALPASPRREAVTRIRNWPSTR